MDAWTNIDVPDVTADMNRSSALPGTKTAGKEVSRTRSRDATVILYTVACPAERSMRHPFTTLPVMFCNIAEVPGHLLGIQGVPS